MPLSRFHHPSVHDLSPGSLRVWVLVGVALVFIGVFALRSVVEMVEFRSRLSVAQQTLATFRYGVLAYSAETQNLPGELLFKIPEKNELSPTDADTPAKETPTEDFARKTSFGEVLVSLKKIDRIDFPFGQKDIPLKPDKSNLLQVNRPQIWAVWLPSFAQYFKNPQLFSSARSGQVAVLVVPFLTAKEAEAIQKIVGNLSESKDGKVVYRGDCFFTHSSEEGKFNGWIFLSDL